jgi:hypothetical protein
MHAHILLKTDSSQIGPGWSDEQIQQALEVGLSTVERVRQRFVEKGLDDALSRRPQSERPEKRKIAGVQEAHLIALSCEPAPSGCKFAHFVACRASGSWPFHTPAFSAT